MIELIHFQFLPESENGVSRLEMVYSFLEVLEAESVGSYNPVALLHRPKSEIVYFNEETKNKGMMEVYSSFQKRTIRLQQLTFGEFTS